MLIHTLNKCSVLADMILYGHHHADFCLQSGGISNNASAPHSKICMNFCRHKLIALTRNSSSLITGLYAFHTDRHAFADVDNVIMSGIYDALCFDPQDSIPSCHPVMPQARQLLEFKANVAPLVVAELRAEDRQHLESRHRGRLADISSKHCQGMLKLISSHKVGITFFQSTGITMVSAGKQR